MDVIMKCLNAAQLPFENGERDTAPPPHTPSRQLRAAGQGTVGCVGQMAVPGAVPRAARMVRLPLSPGLLFSRWTGCRQEQQVLTVGSGVVCH